MSFLANFIRFPAEQTFWKSVKISQNYTEFKGKYFLRHSVLVYYWFWDWPSLSLFYNSSTPMPTYGPFGLHGQEASDGELFRNFGACRLVRYVLKNWRCKCTVHRYQKNIKCCDILHILHHHHHSKYIYNAPIT